MSKTSEKTDWVSRRVAIWLLAFITALSARASVDQPDVARFSANGWHESGWLTHGVQLNVESGKPILDTKEDMVFSPHYGQPIRKVILEAKCTAKSQPTRFLTVCPYTAGVEVESRQTTFTVTEKWDDLSILSLDFAPEDAIDAIRIGTTGTENANWILTRLAVIYGEKTADDDELIRTFAKQLPMVENLTLTGLTSSSLSLGASAVEDAVGYCFELTRLTGHPRTEIREDFAAAPNLSSGWTCDVKTEGLNLSDGGKTYSDSTAGDEHALKIEKATNPKEGLVKLGLVSPLSPEPITEWSFVMRIGTTEKSNRLTVYGRTSETSEWTLLKYDLTPDKQSSNQRFGDSVDTAQGIHQVRFVLTADAASWTTTGLDSLCVVYGGNEARELVSTQTNATPACAWTNLESSRYGYRMKALGATEGERQFKDSSWTEEQTVDLAWADIQLSPPENLAFEVSGDRLNLSWTSVAMADHYEVKVAPANDPENPVATLATKNAVASVPLTELGDYAVTVTAVSLGGVSKAATSLENCTVGLGKVTGLEVEAASADTIAATWKAVPLAEGYQAKLFKVTGEAGTDISDYSKLPEGVWPDGWEDDADWLRENLTTSGPKFTYDGEAVMTKSQPHGMTHVTFTVKSNSSSADKLANQHLQVESYSEKDGAWHVCADVNVTSASQTMEELAFDIADDVRRLRFTALTKNRNYPPAIQLGKVCVSYGAYVRTEVASAGTKNCAATYSGLDTTAKYVVVVTPQPSEGTECEASSVVVDLAAEYFRPVGPVSIAACRNVYFQNFDALAVVTKETDLRRVPLENWQFFKGSGEAEKLFYTSGTNSTKGGVYCYSDAQRTTNSFMIGTVATSTIGSSVGLAFINDTETALAAPTLTFTSVRRNEKQGDPYTLEWLVTDGPWSIGTESANWKTLSVSEEGPTFSVTPSDCRLAPGRVIIFRWRHEKVTGGPMLGLDDVRVEFPVTKPGLKLYLR